MNPLKILSAVIIIAVSTLLGVSKAKKLSDREYILREFITFLTIVKNEIKYMLTVLPNAYEIGRMSLKTQLKDAIGNIATDMLKSKNSISLERSIEENINKIGQLNGYDKALIINILKNLGSTNREGEINLIDNAIKNIENQINEATDIKIRNSRIYRTIGTLFGVAVVIIFI